MSPLCFRDSCTHQPWGREGEEHPWDFTLGSMPRDEAASPRLRLIPATTKITLAQRHCARLPEKLCTGTARDHSPQGPQHPCPPRSSRSREAPPCQSTWVAANTASCQRAPAGKARDLAGRVRRSATPAGRLTASPRRKSWGGKSRRRQGLEGKDAQSCFVQSHI